MIAINNTLKFELDKNANKEGEISKKTFDSFRLKILALFLSGIILLVLSPWLFFAYACGVTMYYLYKVLADVLKVNYFGQDGYDIIEDLERDWR